MKRLFLLLFCVISLVASKHEFMHFMGNYSNCDKWMLEDSTFLYQFMIISAEAGGIANPHKYIQVNQIDDSHTMITAIFSSGSLTVHTFKDERMCFVDLFTTHNKCNYTQFSKNIKWFLNPKRHYEVVFDRAGLGLNCFSIVG